jgi:hypothetical protein
VAIGQTALALRAEEEHQPSAHRSAKPLWGSFALLRSYPPETTRIAAAANVDGQYPGESFGHLRTNPQKTHARAAQNTRGWDFAPYDDRPTESALRLVQNSPVVPVVSSWFRYRVLRVWKDPGFVSFPAETHVAVGVTDCR